MGFVLKVASSKWIGSSQGSQKLAQECYRHSTKSLEKTTIPIDLLEKPDSHAKLESANPLKEVLLEIDKKKKDITGVNPTLITHKLSIDDSFKSFQQKKRNFAMER